MSSFATPGVQVAWNSTTLGLWKECPRKYQYQVLIGWRGRGSNVHLRFGSLYHAALENYDKLRFAGAEHEAALHTVVAETLRATWDTTEYPDGTSASGPWASGDDRKTRWTLIRSIVWYLDEFRHDQAETVRLADGTPAVELQFRLEVDHGLMLFGHLDRVVNYMGGVYVMDRKTAGATLTPFYFERYNPDNQMSLYTLAGQIIYKSPINGLVIDAAQIAVGFTRFQRGIIHRSAAQNDEWLQDFYAQVQGAHRAAALGYYPMNDKACHNYGGCPFRGICSRSPEVRDAFLQTSFDLAPRDPMEPKQ